MTRYSKVEKSVFGLFLLLMLWLPIPLGSNRPWAWAILELTTFTLLIALVIFYSAAVFKSIRENRLVFILALLFIVAQAITIFPLPYQLVETLRPDRVLGVEQSVLPYLSMSFDVAQSKISINSPLSRSLIGKNEGDVFIFKTQAGTKEYTIISVKHK